MNSLNNGENVLGLFLDFSKAFDCVNHEILIRKMCNYGIRGVCLDWFKNYLSDRKHMVLSPLRELYLVVYPKVPSWGHCYF